MVIVNKNRTVKVEWVNLGEGWDGDYNSDDLEDVNLLRFDVSVKKNGKWVGPEDASYCTQMPVSTDEKILRKALESILSEIESAVLNGTHKRICEKLSWISPSDIKL